MKKLIASFILFVLTLVATFAGAQSVVLGVGVNMGGVNAQTGTTYAFAATDQGQLVTFKNSSAVAASLSQATGQFGFGWFTLVCNQGAGTVTITPATSQINGASTFTIATNVCNMVFSDGTNYQVYLGGSGGGGSGTVNNCTTVGALAYYAATGVAVSCDSHITDDGSGDISTSGSLSTGVGGSTAGLDALGGNTANPSLPTNATGFLGPASASFTSYFGQFGTTAPAGSLMLWGTPSFNVSALSFVGSGLTGVQGNGAKIQLSTGSTTTNDCVKFDANGNVVDNGSACGGSGGTPAGSTNDVQINVSGAFAADSGNFVWDHTNHRLCLNCGGTTDFFGIKLGSNAAGVNDGVNKTIMSIASTINDTNFPSVQYAFAYEDDTVASFTNGGANNTLTVSFRAAPTLNNPAGHSGFEDEPLITFSNGSSNNYGVFNSPLFSGTGVTSGVYWSFYPSPPQMASGAAISKYVAYEIPNIACTAGISNCYGFLEEATYPNFFAGCVAVNTNNVSGCSGKGLVIDSSTSETDFSTTGLVSQYAGEATTARGVAPIRGLTSQKTETGSADTNVLTVTPASVAGTYRVSFVVSVASATSGVISGTVSWTDSNGNAQSNVAIPLFQLGTAAPNTTFTTSAAGNYTGQMYIDVNGAGSNIVVKWVGGGTSSAKVTAAVERLN